MKNLFLIITCLVSTNVHAQSFEFGDKITIDLAPNVTLIDAQFSNGNVVAVGFERKGKDINGYIALFDLDGKELNSFSIPNKDVNSQFVKIIDSDRGYYFLENNSIGKSSIVRLLHYSHDLTKLTEWVLTEKQYNLGQDLCFLDAENLLVALWDGANALQSHPVICKLNLRTGKIGHVALDDKNINAVRLIEPDDNWNQEQKDSFNKLAEYEKVKVVKQVNRLIVSENDIYVLGSENSDNISDYWICKLDRQLNILWEEVLDEGSTFGADWLLDGFGNNKGVSLLGYRYFKGKNGYDFNYLSITPEGELKLNKNFDFGNHEIVSGMLNFNSLILQFGTEIKTLSLDHRGELKKQMLLLLIDNDGNILDKKLKEFQDLDKVIKGMAIDASNFLLLGQETLHNKRTHFFQKGIVYSKANRP